MSRYTPKEFAQQIGSGLLSFPITHFKASDLSFDEDAYRKNLAWLFSHDAAGLFAAGGTGALGFKHLGYATTIPLASILMLLAVVPIVDDLLLRRR